MNSSDKDIPDLSVEGEFDDDECTLWGETKINEVIHEANQQQCDPESFIKARKAGENDATPKTEFRTIYQKQQRPTIIQRLLAKWP